MRVLAIDFGTSFSKIGIFEGDELVEKEKGVELNQLLDRITYHAPDKVITSSVTIYGEEILQNLPTGNEVHILSHTSKLPVQIDYATPHTLGTDRVAAVVGAQEQFPEQDCLVIDAGTCITFDFLTAQGVYKGGSISPGMELKFRALNNYTARLPLLERREETDLIGDSTEKAILSGVINGTTAEIREIVRIYRDKSPNLRLVICGGDAEYFHKRLNIECFLAPDLVLYGLKRILHYNE